MMYASNTLINMILNCLRVRTDELSKIERANFILAPKYKANANFPEQKETKYEEETHFSVATLKMSHQ